MKLFSFLARSLSGFFITLGLLLLCAMLFLGYRIATFTQQDNPELLAGKSAYLQKVQAQGIAARPNIVFVLYDDMGYGDIGAGAPQPSPIATPNINRLAAEGISLTNFYSPASVCTPSRAGFLTGRLPLRAGLPYVVFPSDGWLDRLFFRVMNPARNVRLPVGEITLPEVLSAAGYHTGMVGKWHLGDRSPSLPNDFGFDSFFGSHYSNDMTPFELYRNQQVAIAAPVDQRQLSQRYNEEVLGFINAAGDKPFFLYLAHNFPHDPLHAGEQRLGQSAAGKFGDVVEELDEGIGDLVASLEMSGKLDNTLIIISSDNGPWFQGNTGGLRSRKGSTFDGGMRVPFIAHWPAAIAPGQVSDAMAMGTDLMPTLLDILDLPLPDDRSLDGRSLRATLTAAAGSPHDYLYLVDGETLFAVRDQRFKYRAALPIAYGQDEMGMAFPTPQKEFLFDLQADPAETYDVSDRYPQELKRLRAAFLIKRQALKTLVSGGESSL
ncbi:sulfatase [Pseudomaricurvus sp. HS19]|uniref:sulfatase family protein n=1 Tax=Pseudomaricurvus sp. HS19 TaxID=2692626 RepID=UPI001369460F|nr:sulfatase [Pseudomaricurvus sp. HS19]MYM63957.1 sulfatase-like hydrolase/transferase [Pseudomaricurvus sp. HS19]